MSTLVSNPHSTKIAQFTVKSNIPYLHWKETEPDLHFLFERCYGASQLKLTMTSDEKTFLIELELPEEQANKLEKNFSENLLQAEIDKIHGVDPFSGKKDSKLSRLTILNAPARPRNSQLRMLVETCEEKLVELEIKERTRTVDIKTIMNQMMTFQMDILRKFDLLEKKLDEVTARCEERCEKIEKLKFITNGSPMSASR